MLACCGPSARAEPLLESAESVIRGMRARIRAQALQAGAVRADECEEQELAKRCAAQGDSRGVAHHLRLAQSHSAEYERELNKQRNMCAVVAALEEALQNTCVTQHVARAVVTLEQLNVDDAHSLMDRFEDQRDAVLEVSEALARGPTLEQEEGEDPAGIVLPDAPTHAPFVRNAPQKEAVLLH
jgi:Snf7